MSDPLSLGASAVSFISLGLQVCQGLVQYLGAIKDHDDDIATATKQLESLRSAFQVLDDVTIKIKAQPEVLVGAADKLEKCADINKAALDSLGTLLQSLQRRGLGLGGVSSLRVRLEEACQKLCYPFRQGGLKNLQQTTHDLTVSVHVTLEAIIADIGTTHLQKSYHLQQSMDHVHQTASTIMQEIRGLASLVGTEAGAAATRDQLTATKLDDLVSSTGGIAQELGGLQKTVVTEAVASATMLQSTAHKMDDLATASAMRHQEVISRFDEKFDQRFDQIILELGQLGRYIQKTPLQLLEKPAILSEACQDLVSSNKQLQTFIPNSLEHPFERSMPSGCTCLRLKRRTRSIKKRELRIGGLTLYDEHDEMSYHLPKCPQYKAIDEKRQGFRIRLWSSTSRIPPAAQ
ncbi:hypothetical protein F4860DRAFT_419456 [Xylaria cubensis]|nr:hypothetical protein F4860DRAFT_419456 [Xylaria cubensis]